MARVLGLSMASLLLLALAASTADAAFCGAACYRRCAPACCGCTCCEQQCHTVMKTCQKVVYEEHQVTLYKTVYVDVKEKKMVPGVKFVEETEFRVVPVTTWQTKEVECPQPSCGCGSCNACQAASCAPAKCVQKVAVCCLQKVPVKVIREVPEDKPIETVRLVAKQVPYTITCCVPKTVCVEVPVTVCCPVPASCKAKCGCKANGCQPGSAPAACGCK
jgi:hypothetical protein